MFNSNRMQAVLVSCVAAYFSLVVFNNVTDFETNHWFVKTVLGMEGVLSEDVLWRAITAPWMILTAYIVIIACEAVIALLLWCAAIQLFRGRDGRSAAMFGFGLAFCLFMAGFVVVGGEWFYMWSHPRVSGAVTKATGLSTLMLLCFGFFARVIPSRR